MAVFFYLVLIFICALLIYIISSLSCDHWRKFGIPTLPGRLPIFGNILPAILSRTSLIAICEDAYKQTDPASMCGFYYMHKPALLVRDPELIKTVFLKEFANFQDNALFVNPQLDPVITKNPFFSSGKFWKASRTRMINHFSGRKLRVLFSIVDHVSERLTSFVDRRVEENGNGVEFELKKFFSRYTCEIVANAAFGVEGQNFEDNPDKSSFAEIAKEMFEPGLIQFFNQAVTFFVPEVAHALGIKFLPESMDSYFRSTLSAIIEKRRSTGSESQDFLQFVLDHDKDFVDLDLVMAEAISFFIDVYETTSLTMSYLLYRLANNQQVQERLRTEIRRAINENNGKLTYEALKSMSYLDQALFESMRLTPTLGIFMKACTQKTTLKGSDGLFCDIEPGNLVFISASSLHMDRKFWDSPEIYDPDRFGIGESRVGDNYTFLPFGAGPRMCVGQRMGLMTVKLGIAKLVNSFSIEKSPTRNKLEMDPTVPTAIMQYAKDGVWAKFKKFN